MEGGGVILAVRKELRNVTTEVEKTKEKLESLWILIDNNKVKIRIGIVYFPQEKDQDLKEIYKVIKTQIRKSSENKESLIIVGDFNCKVGDMVQGNIGKKSKGGKKLLQVIEKEGLCLGNGMEMCEGKWTWQERNSKSIVDYIIIDEELKEHIKEIKIYDDGNREISPFRLKKKGKKIRTVYSDHNPIVIKTDLVLKQIKTEETTKKYIMTEEGWKRYEKEIEEKKISKVWDDAENIQEAYEQWCKEIAEVKAKYEEVRKITKKRRSKTMRLLMDQKKIVKNQLNTNYTAETKAKLEELKAKVIEEEQEAYYRKLRKNCEEIRKEGKFSSAGFWKVKRKMERRKAVSQHAVRNKNGELVTSNQEILKAYEEHYKNLLTKTNERTKLEENRQTVEKVEKKFAEIMTRAAEQDPLEISEEVVERKVKGLKKRKARDNEGWNNEMIIYGGKEMVKSVTKMANTVMCKYEIPTPWLHMIIKSIHKKGENVDLDNKRGLFLTNVVSKLFEMIIDEMSTSNFDRHQNGGKKKRGIVDVWMVMWAVIDEGRRVNKPVYFFFADLVKCFDRLWLKDCLNDLYDCGMREREIGLIYQLNKEAYFRVDTPAGMTQEISVEEIVKQGTVYGPKLCCASTGKINEGLEETETIFPNLIVKALAYVDDLTSGGSRKFISAVMKKARELEKEKLWEFSVEKSNWLCNKQNIEEIEVEVSQGKLTRTKQYKSLGNMLNEKFNMDDQLKQMETKTEGVVREGRNLCCYSRVGKNEIEAKILVYETMAVKAVFHNVETWTNLRKSDVEKMKSIQARIMRGLFGLPKSTPYWGMIHELGVLPIMLSLTYQKLMLYHNLINSDDDRIGTMVVEAQEESGFDRCWYDNVRKEAEEIGICLKKELVKGKMKSEWKKEVKDKVWVAAEKEMQIQKKESTKMRFLGNKGSDSYLKTTYNEDARKAIIIRLNMVSWVEGNMGKAYPCPLCEEELDTTEHVFRCNATRDGSEDVTVEDLCNGEKMRQVVELFDENEARRRTLLKDGIRTNVEIGIMEGTL